MFLFHTADGDVFAWGYGKIGFGPAVERVGKPQLMPRPLFGRNDLNPDVVVSKLDCGLNFYPAVTCMSLGRDCVGRQALL